ncbi:MAG: long-chain fatty acid--CoA ligase [Cyclobacteriaceae bacterium]|nr:long-chain fatty acid--CoA ligase [Cyclobacteriaceae bacterium]
MAKLTRKSSGNFLRVFDIPTYQQSKYSNERALNYYSNGKWHGYSIVKVQEKAEAIACWFVQQGYQKGDKIIFVPVMGSADWVLLDLACQQAGLVVVPVHPTSQPSEIEVIFRETQARLCITADTGLYFKFTTELNRLEITADLHHLQSGEKGFFKPLTLERAVHDDSIRLDAIRNAITEDDVFTILYTSGSSGIPKGVMLSHRNVVSSIKSILTLLPLEPHHKALSFLPFSHIFERVASYSYMAFGVSVYFSQNKDTFAHDFRTVRPHFCTSVPRVLEKMYDFMLEKTLQRNWLKRKVIRWAMEAGKQYRPGTLKPMLLLKLAIARVLVLSQWRKKLGGRIRYMVVGAASLRPEIGKLFSASGIFVVEGYGMTETAPFISVNRFEPGLNRFGTVGMVLPGVEIKIDSPNEEGEGEILVKGDNVMKGYYKRPELTEAAFTPDGWFRTGDVGKFVYKRFLKITDRKKDIFKTSVGKYIAPLPLQNYFMQSSFIQRCLIIGFQRPYLTALIVPNFEWLELWCTQEGIHWTAPEFMVYNIKVREKFEQEIDLLNEEFPNYQRIKDFILCHQDWTIESGELTTTLKPVRHLLMEHYQKEIDRMYD